MFVCTQRLFGSSWPNHELDWIVESGRETGLEIGLRTQTIWSENNAQPA